MLAFCTRWYQEIRIVMSMASVYDTRHRHDDDTNFLIPPRTSETYLLIKTHVPAGRTNMLEYTMVKLSRSVGHMHSLQRLKSY